MPLTTTMLRLRTPTSYRQMAKVAGHRLDWVSERTLGSGDEKVVNRTLPAQAGMPRRWARRAASMASTAEATASADASPSGPRRASLAA
jgi:hypothetical protein